MVQPVVVSHSVAVVRINCSGEIASCARSQTVGCESGLIARTGLRTRTSLRSQIDQSLELCAILESQLSPKRQMVQYFKVKRRLDAAIAQKEAIAAGKV